MSIPIDPLFIPAFSIEDVILDKDTGAPLTGGLVYFEQDNQRGVLKPIYQITGTSPNYSFIQLPNPMTLSSIGTFEDSLGNPVVPYFFPYNSEFEVELYYVRVTSSTDVPQFVREAVPYVPSSGDASVTSAFENEVSNPQFAEVWFDTTTASHIYSFNAASNQVVEIAPGWSIIVSSVAAATVTVAQVRPTGSVNILTNPGTLLNINSSGVSSLRLRQTFVGSPNLWGSGVLAATFIAKTYAGTSSTLTLYYSQSNGAVVDEVLSTATLPASGDYAAYPGSIFIPPSTSAETNPSASVFIEFDIPLSTQIDISSVMLASTGQVAVDNIIYDQESNARQIDHLFHYYKPGIFFKPINSFLTAWDFALNPAQFGSTKTVTTTPAYIWDQTIMASAVGNVAVVRAAGTLALQATTSSASEAFYMLQYLQRAQAVATTLETLSVNILAYSLVNPGVVVRVYLYNGNGASVIPPTATSLGTLASSGVFTLTAANWALIPQPNGNAMSATLLQNAINDYPLTGWNNNGAYYTAGTANFAIVVTFQVPTAGTQVQVASISCVPGSIATRPAPLTPTDVLNQCKYYWQKSFLPGVVPAQNVGINSGESYGVQASTGATGNTGPLVRFPVEMRILPTLTFYNPLAANAEIANISGSASWSSTTALNIQLNGFATRGTGNVGSTNGDLCGLHWTANARLADF